MTAVLIERTQADTLATVRLNRPDKRNALTLGMWRELEQAFRLRLEAQHGWGFEFSWPSRPEAEAIGAVSPAAP